MFSLGTSPDAWNKFAAAHNDVRSEIERAWERRIFRSVFPSLDNSELRVLLFIKSRTLDWQKYAEAIPMSHFLHGLTDHQGGLLMDDDQQPHCAGCGIRKEDTVRAALKGLAAKRLVHVFRARRGKVNAPNVYMPLAEGSLARQVLGLGVPVLPAHVAGWFEREGVAAREGYWTIVGGREQELDCIPVMQGGRTAQKVVTIHASELRRPTWSEWERASSSETLKLAS